MGRYEIAKAVFKGPEEIKAPPKTKIKSFGFGDSPSFGNEYLRRARSYYCAAGTKKRVGIVFRDTARLFMGTKVHWLNRQYILCKRGNAPSCICCEAAGPRNPATMRIACIIAVYNSEGDYNVLPWVFGRKVYESLNSLHGVIPLQYHDFILERSPDHEIFNPWKTYPPPGSPESCISLWQSTYKEDVLRLAEPHFMNLKSYLGQDLSIEEIRNFVRGLPPPVHPEGARRVERIAGNNRRYPISSESDEIFERLFSDAETENRPQARPRRTTRGVSGRHDY